MTKQIHIATSSRHRVAPMPHPSILRIGVLCALAITFGVVDPHAQAHTPGRRPTPTIAGASSSAARQFVTGGSQLGTLDHSSQAAVPRWFSVGTWNTMLQPWFGLEADVIKTIAATNFDVLALQEVWTEDAKNRILANPLVRWKYRYHYDAPAQQEAGSVPAFVIRDAQEDYVNCLVASGIDTRTIEQPAAPIGIECQMLGLQISFIAPDGFACLVNTMQHLAPTVNPLTAIDLCESSDGARYSHEGRPGLLILSKSPLEDLKIVTYDTFLIRRAVIYATIRGIRFGFTQFPLNYLEDIDPSLGPYQSGPTQTQVAQDVIDEGPDMIVGDFNSGPNYQPAGHNLLLQNGYSPLFSRETFCPPATHASFPQCQPPTEVFRSPAGPRSIDNIYVKGDAAGYRTKSFAESPVSDHIGLAAVYTSAPPVITLNPDLVLFPPNHRYTVLTISQMVQSATDDYDGNVLGRVVIEKVTSDEADNAPGDADGSTVADIVIGPACRTLLVRAERDDVKDGRVYVVTLRVRDWSGNIVRAQYKLSVPIGQNGYPAVEGAAAVTVSSNCS